MSKSAAELRNELKELRKSHPDFKPVSRMHKSDISELIGKLKSKLDHTPAPAMSKMSKAAKEPAVEKETKKMPKKVIMEESELLEEHEHAEKKHKGAVKHAKDVKHAKEAVHAKEAKHPKKAVAEPQDAKKEAMRERMAKIRAMKKKKE
jgi:hypothetical protein